MVRAPSGAGKPRKKRTAWSVRAADAVARILITIGGIGTLVAVSTVFFYLLWVVAPLLRSSRLSTPVRVPALTEGAQPLCLAIDEYQLMGWLYRAGGRVDVFSLTSGRLLASHDLGGSKKITAAGFGFSGEEAVFGYADGSIAAATLGFAADFVADAHAPPAAQALAAGENVEIGEEIWSRMPSGQLRVQRAVFQVQPPLAEESPHAVRLVDRSQSVAGDFVASLHDDGTVFVSRLTRRRNILTGQETVLRASTQVPVEPHPQNIQPVFLGLSELADTLTVIYEDGLCRRYDLRNFSSPVLLDQTFLLEEPGLRISACRYLLGRTTLLVGDTSGRVRTWFPVPAEQRAGDTHARTRLVAAHTFPGTGVAVTALATSRRMRMFVAGYADGRVRLRHVTSEKQLADAEVPGSAAPIAVVALTPKDDGIVAFSGEHMARWHLDVGHPEATLASLFCPVWYEGAPEPAHVWQSSAGTDDFEPKFGLMPLVFGTIKATVFSLLFGVPIALLAAVFTSEFLNAQMRAIIKPLVEMMASLPSVVLGFLAALVFAPVVAGILPAVLAAFVLIPATFLFGARLWQLLPAQFSLRYAGWRLPLVFLCVPVGLWLAAVLGPMIERVCFAGDIMRWLDGQVGGAAGGWAALCYPLAALVIAAVFGGVVNPWLGQKSRAWSRGHCAVADAIKFMVGLALTVPTAAGLGWALSAAGLDPRGSLLGTYVQRNAMVVGFVMGFAVIPIIYTLAEDALAAVPDHLRSASLAAGATPWQTAWRIVLPTAMSGVFSAVMIGVGRAVGETMIVLMAAGNTPIMQWNPFNGFRTLSANIAVELPEAVRNSTHYRTLFLAALVLFMMTFVLNTIAEIVRLRYRRKAVEL